jgi:hypothetical protein
MQPSRSCISFGHVGQVSEVVGGILYQESAGPFVTGKIPHIDVAAGVVLMDWIGAGHTATRRLRTKARGADRGLLSARQRALP